MTLHRYWFEFDTQDMSYGPLRVGCGITAYTLEEATQVLHDVVFRDSALPPIKSVQIDVDVSTLDPLHVRPNMGLPLVRGVWFPLGY